MTDDALSRRSLLGKLVSGLSAAGGLSLHGGILPGWAQSHTADDHRSQESHQSPSDHPTYTIGPWTGDNFQRGHKFRDKHFPTFPSNPESSVDCVIVGGGVAGLAAAYYLRNYNCLLLEQYDQLGGHSRGGDFRGLAYSYGPNILSNPSDLLLQMLSEFDLKPAQLEPSSNSWLWQSRWLRGIVRGLEGSEANIIYSEFKRLKEELAPLWGLCGASKVLVSSNNVDLMNLDRQSFSTCLTGYSAPFLNLIDSYLKSSLCGGTDKISALAGALTLRDLFEPNFALPGGNAAITSALVKNINAADNKRITSGAFVWSIQLGDDQSYISYTTSDGTSHKITCKHVIVTSPLLVSARIFSNLSDAARMELFGYRYGSYLVANLLLRQQVLNSGYTHFLQPPFSFSELAVVETPYKLTGNYHKGMGSALTVYQPYEPASKGRDLLLAGDRDLFSSSIISQLGEITEHLSENLEQIVLTRWGHALVVPTPGHFAKLKALAQNTSPSYTLAHSSTQGLPCVESALAAARKAADRAMRIKIKSNNIYSCPGLS